LLERAADVEDIDRNPKQLVDVPLKEAQHVMHGGRRNRGWLWVGVKAPAVPYRHISGKLKSLPAHAIGARRYFDGLAGIGVNVTVVECRDSRDGVV
ncbi:MAG: hypothetical protein JNM35_02625, partial [Nitrospira sp.]|nr:hypothetical protein [Nitrospira sp.]